MTDKRIPDELDALLQKIDEEEQNEDDMALASGGHRKSNSVDVGSIASANKRGYRHQRRQNRGHRKNKSSISELYDAIKTSNLEPIREDFRNTAWALRTNFVHGLDEMDSGMTGFFDMSMTRSLSVIPDSITDLAIELGVQEESDEDEEEGGGKVLSKPSGPPVLQYFALLGAVFAVSSNSTALHMLDGVTPTLKLYWRMTASYVALLPLAFYYICKDGLPELSLSQLFTFIAAVLCYSTHALLFYTALQYTTIGNAVIYANSQALLLVIGKACVGQRIHILEALGVVVAFSGAIMCSVDSEGSAKGEDDGNGLIGDSLALCSAAAGVAYLTFAKAVRSTMPVSVFIFSVMFFGSLCVLLLLAIKTKEPLEWNMDPYDGVFGWLNADRLPVLIYLSVICNMLGTMGFVRAMAYFDNVIIAVATLTEPLMASLIAYSFHAGNLPGRLGWFGNLLVVMGTIGVVYPSMGKGNSLH